MQKEIFYQLKSGTTQQLVCFPYLGGYVNSYFRLARVMSESIEVWASNPPGHGGSTADALSDIRELVDVYFLKLKELIKPNCVLFGHSMGAVVAYFLLQKIMDSDLYPVKPVGLVLSACNPPSFFSEPSISSLSQEDFIAHVFSFCVIPEAVLQEQSLIDYFLSIFRADFSVLESSALCEFKPLTIPVYYLWGEEDKIVPFESVLQWSKYFKTEIKIIPVAKGSHMFIDEQVEVVAQTIEHIVNEISLFQKEASMGILC